MADLVVKVANLFVKVFSADYHLETLEVLLQACTHLQSDTDVLPILIAIISRITEVTKTCRSKDPRTEDAEETAQPEKEMVEKAEQSFSLITRYITMIVSSNDKATEQLESPVAEDAQDATNFPVTEYEKISLVGVLKLYACLLQFSTTVFPEALTHVDSILGLAATLVKQHAQADGVTNSRGKLAIGLALNQTHARFIGKRLKTVT